MNKTDSIRSIYHQLVDLFRLYDRSACYTRTPKGMEGDIMDYIDDRLLDIRADANAFLLGDVNLRGRMERIIDESEIFLKSHEVPGIVPRWRQLYPRINFFDCRFDLPEGLVPDAQKQDYAWKHRDEVNNAKEEFFRESEEKNNRYNLGYSDDRIFQDALIRTLTTVFEHDFQLVFLEEKPFPPHKKERS
jgi:hypothetical protein